MADDVLLEVSWYKRKAFKAGCIGKDGIEKHFSWGVQPTFQRSIPGYTNSRIPMHEQSLCMFSDLLPIAVTVSKGSTDAEPKPEKRCVLALVKHCKESTNISLWAAPVPVAVPQPLTGRNRQSKRVLNSSEDDSEEEEEEEEEAEVED